jgi:trigger factor
MRRTRRSSPINGLKLAFEPQIRFPENKDEIEAAMEAKGDLAFTVALEVLPKIELADLSDVALTKPVAEVPDADVDAALSAWPPEPQLSLPRARRPRPRSGDRLIDLLRRHARGQGFRRRHGRGHPARSRRRPVHSRFRGAARGRQDRRDPHRQGDLPRELCRGPSRRQAGRVRGHRHRVQAPEPVKIDDELAKSFGMESLDKLKDAIREQIGRDFGQQSRRKLKKGLLDALDGKYTFELPPTLVEQEFASVWSQVEVDMKEAKKSFADEDTTEDAAKRRLPQDRRAPRAPRPRAGRDRRAGQGPDLG